jgi:hypothetical protein
VRWSEQTADLDRASRVDGPLTLLFSQLPPGRSALIVDALETTPEPLDQLATRFGAIIDRQPRAWVAAEVKAAEAATAAAQREAEQVLRRRKPPSSAGRTALSGTSCTTVFHAARERLIRCIFGGNRLSGQTRTP